MTENAISINIKPDAAEIIKSKMDADHQIVILALDDGSTKYSKKGGTCTIGDSFQFVILAEKDSKIMLVLTCILLSRKQLSLNQV